MKLDHNHLYEPKRVFALKKILLHLNWDLDAVRSAINHNSSYGWAYNHSISPHSTILTKFEMVILFLEDRRFYKHSGCEVRSLLRGIKRLAIRGKINGISTIDQQVVRIALRRNDRTISRKVREIILAICINFHTPKRAIMDYYIHNAYLGYRMEGCEISSIKIFGRNASKLDEKQAAFIACLFPLPFPKSVWLQYKKDQGYPFQDPTKIISFAKKMEPRWASRIWHRYEHAITCYNRTPNSL